MLSVEQWKESVPTLVVLGSWSVAIILVEILMAWYDGGSAPKRSGKRGVEAKAQGGADAAVVVASGRGPLEADSATTVYERLGDPGEADKIIAAIVTSFYKRLRRNPQISPFFRSTVHNRHETRLREFVRFAFGAPGSEGYLGRGLNAAHRNLRENDGMQDVHFDLVVGEFKSAMEDHNVSRAIITTVGDLLETLRDQVMGRAPDPRPVPSHHAARSEHGSAAGSGHGTGNQQAWKVLPNRRAKHFTRADSGTAPLQSRGGAPKEEEQKTLYDKLGGEGTAEKAIAEVSTKFLDRLLEDPTLTKFFENVDMDRVNKHFTLFVTHAFGGPNVYATSLYRIHKPIRENLGLNETHFNLVAGHLETTVREDFQMSDGLVKEIMAVIETARPRILGHVKDE
ncbi:unnamed protein product [Pedinophyceae sp. YPF-701]|nr:unnamed protein product [Pedinophyceae sp. YPF-701]